MTPSTLKIAFREWFGVPPAEADLLATLYNADGQFIPIDDLLPDHDPRSVRHTVHQRIANLRKAMDTEAIDSVPRKGYRLSEVGLAEIRGVITSIAAEFQAAAVALQEAA